MGKQVERNDNVDEHENGGNDGSSSGNAGNAENLVNLDAIEPAADTGGNNRGKTGRPRGRPRKDGTPAGSGGNDNNGNSNGAKTGNKRRSRKAENQTTLDVGTISLGLAFISGVIAARAKEPTLKLDDAEAMQVAQATANVAAFYDIPVSPVMQAWLALGMTVGSIYAGKIAAIKMRRTSNATPADNATNAPNIAPFIRKEPIEAAE